MINTRHFLRCFLYLALFLSVCGAQTGEKQKALDVPVMDGEAGPCSVEFEVNDLFGKPVYAARIDVHIAYGFLGLHKLDMGVYTNSDGKARFVGIPAKVRNPPLEFSAAKGEQAGIAVLNPATECQARHDIILDKRPAANSTSAASGHKPRKL